MKIFQYDDPLCTTDGTKWIAAQQQSSADTYAVAHGWMFDSEIFEDGRYATLTTSDLLRVGCDAVQQGGGFVT